ncbi:MAG: actin-binding WH2 domain-containing protein, partial [Anaerolineae bacterium]
TISGLVGVTFLSHGMGIVSYEGGEGRRARRTVVWLWIILYAFVGSQMAWTLRPFVGAPGLPFELFRQLGGNFYANVLASLGEVLGFVTVR